LRSAAEGSDIVSIGIRRLFAQALSEPQAPLKAMLAQLPINWLICQFLIDLKLPGS
jgi:hypothetical protein